MVDVVIDPIGDKKIPPQAIALIVLAVGVLVFFGVRWKLTPMVPISSSISPTPTSLSSGNNALPANVTLIYSEEIRSESFEGRAWATFRIAKLTGQQSSEVIAEVGGVGEYPLDYLLSVDHQTLYINLESKIVSVDLATKQVTTIFMPKYTVQSMVLSPKGNELLIWDQANDKYVFHRFSMKENKDQILDQGIWGEQGYVILEKWRTDDMVLGFYALGEASIPLYIDLANPRERHETGDADLGGPGLSPSGMLGFVAEKSIDNPCFELTGSTPSEYKIVEPVSQKVIDVIPEVSGNTMSVLYFSPNEDAVLYSTEVPAKDYEYCSDPVKKNYSIKMFGKPAVPVPDLEVQLRAWKIVDAEIAYPCFELCTIYFEKTPIVTSGKFDRIIDKYYE